MKMKNVVMSSLVACSFIFAGSNVSARSFGNSGQADMSNLMNSANHQQKCYLYKMSRKGGKGFLGGSKMSLEATCQDEGGNDFEFSASGRFFEDLVKYAAQEVIIITGPNNGPNNGPNRVENAKTMNALISIKPVNDTEIDEQVVCGPENPANIDYDVKESKIYSSGYRVSRPVAFGKIRKEWQMKSYVGITDDNEWKSKGSNYSGVLFTQGCARSISTMLPIDEPLIFDYMQTKEGGKYTIGRAAVITQ